MSDEKKGRVDRLGFLRWLAVQHPDKWVVIRGTNSGTILGSVRTVNEQLKEFGLAIESCQRNTYKVPTKNGGHSTLGDSYVRAVRVG